MLTTSAAWEALSPLVLTFGQCRADRGGRQRRKGSGSLVGLASGNGFVLETGRGAAAGKKLAVLPPGGGEGEETSSLLGVTQSGLRSLSPLILQQRRDRCQDDVHLVGQETKTERAQIVCSS